MNIHPGYVYFIVACVCCNRWPCEKKVAAKTAETVTRKITNQITLETKRYSFFKCYYFTNYLYRIICVEEEAKSVAMMKTADGLYELSSSSGDSDGTGELDDDLESTLDR